MQSRRNLLIALGSSAAAGGIAFGTGAFDQVSADRTATVNVVGDDSAYLKLSPNDNSPHAELNNNNLLVIDVGDLPDTSDYGDGKGVNEEGITRFNNLFTVTNQGTQDVGVTITPYNTDPEQKAEVTSVAFFETDQGGNLGDVSNVENRRLTVGHSFDVGLEVDTRGDDDDVDALNQVEVKADAEDAGGDGE